MSTSPTAATVTWDDGLDDIFAGDLVAALAYTTPAGGVVVTPVCPLGLRDRANGRIGFTTALGNGRKLDRMTADPRIALAFHTRQHGTSSHPGFVLVQGTAAIEQMTPEAYAAMDDRLGIVRGRLWDRIMHSYYHERVVVWLDVRRITVRAWEAGTPVLAGGSPRVIGAPLAMPPEPQRPPWGGTGPRLDAARAARRVAAHEHVVLGYRASDGFPDIVQAGVASAGGTGIILTAVPPLPAGGRRACLLGHSFRAGGLGVSMDQHTGWIQAGEELTYAPHTVQRFTAPANKFFFTLANGVVALSRQRTRRRHAT
jgi:nitroimidazol reductase NimA-like FMN-containing flavoprotein (pyridoxamine 5'-phosphate oxidase superfamily)